MEDSVTEIRVKDIIYLIINISRRISVIMSYCTIHRIETASFGFICVILLQTTLFRIGSYMPKRKISTANIREKKS